MGFNWKFKGLKKRLARQKCHEDEEVNNEVTMHLRDSGGVL
jgi:hypothetical protein